MPHMDMNDILIDPRYVDDGVSPLIVEIRRERRVELFISGKTYIDVYIDSDWDNPLFDESKYYLWLIPLSALSQNPEIGQNPGWWPAMMLFP